ncbi:MAG TPA: molybdopterin-dependent oxidoreductase, partial [Nitrospira sp.]|nr:molybdopterin-dependent oxidoreductase [Nitrospira sp.]
MEQLPALKIFPWDDAAVRNAIQERNGPLFLTGHRRTWLHDHATDSYFAAPDDVARLGFAVAHAIDDGAPPVSDLADEVRSRAARIAAALLIARRPLVIGGTRSGSDATIEAAANVAWALHRKGKHARITFALEECNSLGLALLGGGTLESAFDALRRGEIDTAIVLENDLYRRTEHPAAEEFLKAARGVIVIDSLEHRTTEAADVILPAATVPESDGTLVNQEGRAQRFFQVFVPDGDVAESWRWLRDLARALDRPLAREAETMGGLAGWKNLDDAVTAAAAAVPEFAKLGDVAPGAGFRIAGKKIPRQPERYSGRTAMLAHLTVHEPPPPDDPDTPLAFSMEGYRGPVPSPLIPQFWSPGWNSVQALNKYQDEAGGPLREERPGIRLIEPIAWKEPVWFTTVPGAFRSMPGRWLLLPVSELFGTEELSARSPAIGTRIPAPFILFHPSDGRRLGLEQGGAIALNLQARSYRVSVRFDPSTPLGTAGLSLVGDAADAVLPAWVDLAEAIRTERRAA